MPILSLNLLGDVQVLLADQPITHWSTSKVRALLVYLAVERRPHRRSELAEFLWPGYSPQSTANSLRVALHQLRQILGDTQTSSPFLLTTRHTLELNLTSPIQVDVATFTTLISQCNGHAHVQMNRCPECLARLRQAIALYRGDFLAGFALDDSTLFEEWRRIKQEQFHIRALDALTQLAHAAEAAGDDEQALHDAQHQLALEPWWEGAHRQIMRILARRGQLAAATAQYKLCCQVLAREFGIVPNAETTALYEQINGRTMEQEPRRLTSAMEPSPPDTANGTTLHGTPPALAPLISAPPLYDWGEMPAADFFAGRTTEVAQLTAWLQPTIRAHASVAAASDLGQAAQLVSILGMGGMGKTTLAAVVVKAVAPTFTVVIWRSLLNAPPLKELLRAWLQLLSRQTLAAPPASLDEQLHLLLTHLRQERCLLVLDNVESIFATDMHGRAGVTRPGYEGYDQLLQRLGASDHQSCLLLTSREQPYALTQLGRQAQGPTGRIRMLQLNGLIESAAVELLRSNGLHTSDQEAVQLIESYSGNPLALQIVAAAIADYFAGDVAAYQQAGGALFDGMRLVLDQQFARLSALEREILIWLAIEREVITAPMLRANFAQPAPMHEFIEALQALQNRALLEKRENGFTLQNVIIEYTTDYLVEQVCGEIVGEWEAGQPGDKAASGDSSLLTPPLAASFLNRFALLQAQAKEYVRQSQARLIMQPLAERLAATMGQAQVAAAIPHLLDALRAAAVQTGYAAGNLLNLLLTMQIDGRGCDFSGLNLGQAFLRGMTVQKVNFSGADLSGAVFTDCFGLINCVAINPAQTLIAAGTGAGEIRLWRYANRQPVALMPGRQKPVWSVVFSPDGRLLASSDDQTVQLWEIETNGDLVQPRNCCTLVGHTSDVHTLAFSPDGAVLASAGYDQSICVWNLASGAMLQRFSGHSSCIYSLAFSPDGRWIASGSDDQTIRLWELQSQNCRILRGHTERVYGVAFHPQGRLLATCSADHSVRLWDVARSELCQTLCGHTGIVRTIAFHPTGAWLASGSYDKTIRVWSIQDVGETAVSGEISQILQGHTDWVRALTFSPDGKTLISGGIDHALRVWGLQGGNGQAHHILHGHTNLIRAVAFSPDGAALVSGSNDNMVRIWDMRQRGAASVRQMLPGHTQMVRTVAFHPGGQIIASGGFDKKVRLWVQAADDWRLQYTLAGHTDLVRSVAFSPDGLLLASAGSDQTIRLWDVATGRHLYTLHEPSGTVWSVAFHPDGQRMASGSADHAIRLWDVHNRAVAPRLYASWPAHAHEVKTVAFSPDGQTLASSGDDKTIRLWDMNAACPERRLRQMLHGHTGFIWCVAFHPAGRMLASCSSDQSVRVWDLHECCGGEPRCQTLEGHTGWVWSVAFSPDGQTLASSSDDETIRLWGLRDAGVATSTVLRIPGPYAGMNISGVTGISEAQKASLRALGAVEE
ncbi:MAG: BTAD domain-containing putative transcriptional regulator [Caldilineaceae bacterium]